MNRLFLSINIERQVAEMEKCNHDHRGCSHAASSALQTLDEMDFERGPWSAALGGDLPRLKNLLEKKSLSVDLLDSSGYTSLHYAARAGRLDAVKYLVTMGASINLPTRANSSTALHKAVIAGHQGVVKYLLDRGAAVEPVDAAGHTPLFYALQAGNAVIEGHLTVAGASIKT